MCGNQCFISHRKTNHIFRKISFNPSDCFFKIGSTWKKLVKNVQEQTLERLDYRWRQKCVGRSPDMIEQLKTLQKENAQLKRLVAGQALDIYL